MEKHYTLVRRFPETEHLPEEVHRYDFVQKESGAMVINRYVGGYSTDIATTTQHGGRVEHDGTEYTVEFARKFWRSLVHHHGYEIEYDVDLSQLVNLN